MASPQLENGYTAIANEIMEAFGQLDLTGYESRVLHILLRMTYGFHRTTITLEGKIRQEFYRLLRINRHHISRTLKMLKSRNLIVIKGGNRNHLTIGFQKDSDKWILSSKGVTHHKREKMTKGVTQNDEGGNNSLSKGVTQNDEGGNKVGSNLSNSHLNSDPKYNYKEKKEIFKERKTPSASKGENREAVADLVTLVVDEIPLIQTKDPQERKSELEKQKMILRKDLSVWNGKRKEVETLRN